MFWSDETMPAGEAAVVMIEPAVTTGRVLAKYQALYGRIGWRYATDEEAREMREENERIAREYPPHIAPHGGRVARASRRAGFARVTDARTRQ